MDTDKIIVKSIQLRKYRELMKRIGIHDNGFLSIKNDIGKIRQQLITMNMAYDTAGVFAEKSILAMRLLTYGEYEGDLSIEDIQAMVAPLDAMAGLTDQTFASHSGLEFITHSLPICFSLANSDLKDMKVDNIYDLKSLLRHLAVITGNLKQEMIGKSLTLGFCLHKYGMSDLIESISESVDDIVIKSTGDAHEVYIKAREIFGKTINQDINKFAVGLSILLSECNLGNMDYNIAANILGEMRSQAIKHGHKEDFIKFVDSYMFPIFAQHVLEYYIPSKDDKEDDDE